MSQLTPTSDIDGARSPKACQPCAAAKVRCEFQGGEKMCLRCQRLKKSCGDQVPGAHRRKRPIAHSRSVLDVVENTESFTSKDPESSPFIGNTIPALNAAYFSPALWISRLVKSDEEGELLLRKFRLEFSQFFPFVAVPPVKTFLNLRDESPFVLIVSLMVACRDDGVLQSAVAKKIREIISFSVLVKGEQSLDLLQGLMLFLAWYHLHMHLGSQVSNLIHIIMALMTDLGLDNCGAYKNCRPTYANGGYFGKHGPVPVPAFARDRSAVIPITKTLEGCRTFLGCFFLSSVVSMCARDIEPIKQSKYVAECCQVLLEGMQYPTDSVAVHLVRLHGVADRISQALCADVWDYPVGLNSAPIGVYVKALESELMQLKRSPAEGTNEYSESTKGRKYRADQSQSFQYTIAPSKCSCMRSR
ncbi:uncharacterized protein A1O9_07185 [Exophiala aquamarina CBS 119918]|uniref:Zn(2)-C6 fungal-type domain-containing protein n=1 Tax=Exophiala aquamarina CBS 119918 TaxID=1182545 RepID=A0A072PN77_9EURO|nr:uncharacterized protein A1O9_07185 [Exophiala aquamarina CBS 119918]KEF56995.1 hypothetical protein A1O9_07185 [Exophiala aquamarina CBS 119918]